MVHACATNADTSFYSLAVSKEDADRDVVQWFLDNGADPDCRCLIDKTALSYAVSHAPLDIIELLIEHVHRPQHGELSHSVAFRPTSMGDHATLIELLLRRTPFGVNSLIYGGDVYSRALIAYTGAGTPLHFAAVNDRPEVASALINAGANPAILDDKGDCPIDIARRQNYGAVIEVLLRAENQERI
jgi:ankyrin repeat protein